MLVSVSNLTKQSLVTATGVGGASGLLGSSATWPIVVSGEIIEAATIAIHNVEFAQSGSNIPATLNFGYVYTGDQPLTGYGVVGGAALDVTAAQLIAGAAGIDTVEYFSWDAEDNDGLYLLDDLTLAAEGAQQMAFILSDGVAVSEVQTVAVTGLDFSPTLLTNTTPANNATDVSILPTVTLTFAENVVAGDGDVRIYEDAVLVRTLAASTCTFTDNVVRVRAGPYTLGANVHLEWDEGAFIDVHGNPVAAAINDTTLEFTVEATSNLPIATPLISSQSHTSGGNNETLDISGVPANGWLYFAEVRTGGAAGTATGFTVDGVPAEKLGPSAGDGRCAFWRVQLPAGGLVNSVFTDTGATSFYSIGAWHVTGTVANAPFVEMSKSGGADDLTASVATGLGCVLGMSVSYATGNNGITTWGGISNSLSGLNVASRVTQMAEAATDEAGSLTVSLDHVHLNEELLACAIGLY